MSGEAGNRSRFRKDGRTGSGGGAANGGRAGKSGGAEDTRKAERSRRTGDGGGTAESLPVQIRQAMAAALPVALSYVPLAMVFGALARATGLSLAEAAGMSLLIYSGAAQLLAVQMLAGGAAYGGVLTAGTVLGLRHVLMGASIARFLHGVPPRIKAAMALLLTDESFALALGRYRARPGSHAYFLSVNLFLYASWNAGTIAGFFLGQGFGGGFASFDLSIVFPLLFLAIAVQMAKTPVELGAAAAGLVLALALRPVVPAAWLILIAAVAVALACVWFEERFPWPPGPRAPFRSSRQTSNDPPLTGSEERGSP